jgi:hypothetical protein
LEAVVVEVDLLIHLEAVEVVAEEVEGMVVKMLTLGSEATKIITAGVTGVDGDDGNQVTKFTARLLGFMES